VRLASSTHPGDLVQILLHEGTVGATITEVDAKRARKR